MSATKNIRGNCQQCDGPFDFPVEGIGQTIQCPHCGKPTELMLAPPSTPPSSGISSRHILYIVLLIVIILGGSIGVMAALKRAQRMKAAQKMPDAPNPTTPPTQKPQVDPADPFAKAGFQASPVTIEKATSGSLVYALGSVKNISDKKKFGVRIELELRDAENWKLGVAKDYTPSIEPGAEWKFRALLINSKTANATIIKIEEDK